MDGRIKEKGIEKGREEGDSEIRDCKRQRIIKKGRKQRIVSRRMN